MLRVAVFVSLLACCFAGVVPRPGGRIVGGDFTEISKYPHQISMQKEGRHRCGGSIYSHNIIVSAAHCVVGLDEVGHGLTIAAGATKLSDMVQVLHVHRFYIHPDYNTAINDYDVAVLVLKGRFEYSQFIQPIRLAPVLPPAGSWITVSGWGVEKSGDRDVPNNLKYTEVQMVEQKTCKRRNLGLITDRMFCAGIPGGGTDACQGDSGGPMIFENTLIGVVSWGFGCGASFFPGVYGSIPEFVGWIEQTANEHEIRFL